ncbi:hypothetical protein HPP92_017509 [Vanilla planifolia]|uniref:Uncharacterized protein n=1 Tax=Vanilla planifolia TaxID=51239 RepID=A0A835QE67_VANPL|nr:hypothetical protein HPP92_017509 [Vanilla planifolia]
MLVCGLPGGWRWFAGWRRMKLVGAIGAGRRELQGWWVDESADSRWFSLLGRPGLGSALAPAADDAAAAKQKRRQKSPFVYRPEELEEDGGTPLVVWKVGGLATGDRCDACRRRKVMVADDGEG